MARKGYYERPVVNDYAIVMKGKFPKRNARVFVLEIEEESALVRYGNHGTVRVDINRLTKQ